MLLFCDALQLRLLHAKHIQLSDDEHVITLWCCAVQRQGSYEEEGRCVNTMKVLTPACTAHMAV